MKTHKKTLEHPQGFTIYLKVTIPPCHGSRIHCNSDEWWEQLQRAMRGEPAYLAVEGVRPELHIEPHQLVLDRIKWAGVYCRKCRKATVEVATEPTELAPRPKGQLSLF